MSIIPDPSEFLIPGQNVSQPDALAFFNALKDQADQNAAALQALGSAALNSTKLFYSRSAMKTALSNGDLDSAPDGTTIVAGDLIYRKQSGATVIHDLPGLVCADVTKVSVRHHGAVGGGVDDTAAANSAVVECAARIAAGGVAPWLYIDMLSMYVTDEIDFGAVYQSGDDVKIKGVCSIEASAFGRGKAIFRVDQGGAVFVQIDGGLHLTGQVSFADPIGFYIPKISTHARIDNVSASSLSNSLIVTHEVDNSKMRNCRITGGQGQVLERDMANTTGSVVGSTVTIYDQAGVNIVPGKLLGMEGRSIGIGGATYADRAHFGQIISVNADGSSCEIDPPAPFDTEPSEQKEAFFQAISGSGTAGSKDVVVTKVDSLPPELVGGFISIRKGAGETARSYHLTTVESVSGNTITLVDPLEHDVVDQYIYTCMHYIVGPLTRDRHLGAKTNEFIVDGCVSEKPGGIGFYFNGPTNTVMQNCKSHGARPHADNPSKSGCQIVADDARGGLIVKNHTFGVPNGYMRSAVEVCGESSDFFLDGGRMGRLPPTTYALDVDVNPERHSKVRFSPDQISDSGRGEWFNIKPDVRKYVHIEVGAYEVDEALLYDIPLYPLVGGVYPMFPLGNGDVIRLRPLASQGELYIASYNKSSGQYYLQAGIRSGLDGNAPRRLIKNIGSNTDVAVMTKDSTDFDFDADTTASKLNVIVMGDYVVIANNGVGNLEVMASYTGPPN